MKSNSTFKFIARVVATYTVGLLIYDLWILPETDFDKSLIHLLVCCSEPIIQMMGYVLLPHQSGWHNTIHIHGSNGVWISSNCDGFALVWVFSAVLFYLPGGWRHKAIYLLSGSLVIEIFNILRIISLAIIEHHFPQSLAFNHDYTFTVLVYGVVVGLWFFWLKRFQFLGENE